MEDRKLKKNQDSSNDISVDTVPNDETSDALTLYLKEISKIPVLSPEEEKELSRRIRQGDREALKKLVKHNLRFVVSIAKKYRNFGVPFLDLINEGNLGLIKAAKKFDPDKDIKFISYASWWVKQSIIKFLTEQSTPIKIPIKAKTRNRKIDEIISRFKKELNQDPNKEEIMEESGLSEKELKNAELAKLTFDSLDQFVNDDKDATLLDLISSDEPSLEEKHIQESLIEDINKYLSTLPEREQDIIRLRYGLYDGKPRTLREIGNKYNISKERVRQLENSIMEKLRKKFKGYK